MKLRTLISKLIEKEGIIINNNEINYLVQQIIINILEKEKQQDNVC